MEVKNTMPAYAMEPQPSLASTELKLRTEILSNMSKIN